MCLKRILVGLMLTGFLYAEENGEPTVNPYAPPTSVQEEPPLPSYKRSFAYGSVVGLVALYAIISSTTDGQGNSFLSALPRIPPALWADGNYRLRFSGIHLAAMAVFGGAGLAVRLLAGELKDYFSQPKISNEPTLFDDLSIEPLAPFQNCGRSTEKLAR